MQPVIGASKSYPIRYSLTLVQVALRSAATGWCPIVQVIAGQCAALKAREITK